MQLGGYWHRVNGERILFVDQARQAWWFCRVIFMYRLCLWIAARMVRISEPFE